jgi:hypothetical protein
MITRFFAAALATLLVWPAFVFSQAMKAGTVTILQGHATARRPALPDAVPLKVDDDVFLMDTIATGGGARIEMLLGGKAHVVMQERSTVTITEVPGRSTLALQAGRLAMSLAGAGMRPGEELHVRTPNAVAAVRGGVRMIVETVPPTQAGGAVVTHVDVLEGSIVVAIGAGTPTPAMTIDANHRLTITGDVAGPIRALRMSSPPTKHGAQP